jgi:DNA polymerase III delta prime subunit
MNIIIKNKAVLDSKVKKIDIHQKLKKKLDYFIENHKIPHIIFYGNCGTGKRYILNYFIEKIYKNDSDKIKEYVMYVNCAHCKGIRFIRDDIKFFAKRNMQNDNGKIFKSIILFNAEKLTTDAQSALRRCIENFSHNTRFFIVIENIDNLLNPILSRFCNIYIPYPIINNNKKNLFKMIDKSEYEINFNKRRELWLKKNLSNKKTFSKLINLVEFIAIIYDKGYNALDILKFIENSNNKNKYKFLLYFDKIRREFRNEKNLMFIYCYLFLMRKNINLENILTM